MPAAASLRPSAPGGLAVGELLEVTEQDDLAVVVIQLEQGRVEPALELAAQGLGRGRQRRVAQLMRPARAMTDPRRPAGRPTGQRPFAIHASACRPDGAADARR